MSRLGYDVQFIDGLSTDHYGVLAKTELSGDNVGLDLCLHNSDKPTCLATVTLDEHKKASYEFLIDGTATFDFDENWLPDFDVHKPSVLHLGTLATIIEPGASAIYNWAAEGATKHGVPVVFDPNIRPSVMPDRNAYQKAVERFAKISSVIKASDDDIEWLYPDLPHEEVATKWLGDELTSLVIITKGEDGLTSLTKDGNVISESPAIQIIVKDTVGAGDTVGAILTEGVVKHGIAKLVEEPDFLRSVLSRANKASGITCSREGCKPPTQADLE
jgi:fructokinase